MRGAGKRIGKQSVVAVILAATLFVSGCASPQETPEEQALDPSNPVQVEVWTYYNGHQQQAFESLVADFNATKGKEVGVSVTHASQGGVNDLAAAVTASAEELVGAGSMPSIFLTYADTAYVIDRMGKVADLDPYFTAEEKGAFIDSFLAEGDFAGDGGLKLLPISKATETVQINMTDWAPFAEQTGSTLDEFETIEGITALSQRYYEWTDAQTPDVADDGKPFFGRDSMANYLITGSKQLGHELFAVKDGVCTPDIDTDAMRALWDNYYVPLINGYFSAEGRYRSDAIKTGDLICYLGSSSSVVYFPAEVTVDDQTSYPIEFGALAAPRFSEGVACAPQQGAGFAVAKSDERTELACVEFLKWLTEKEQNTSFSIEAGYIPVTQEACTYENIAAVAEGMEDTHENYLINLEATLETVSDGVYANAPFAGGVDARAVLETSMSDAAIADREQVLAAIASGESREEAVASLNTDERFEAWLESFTRELTATLG
ncbi:extracellular solute-binding protein [Raoultibacter phocaeensis]|uniref:extracellular solute-binding protein n=1 Tax=Raoultibacter phocaeensis TaxID=2479841 RepID=UPI0011195997|nr:extracellular solute-binding protein [Raoultibacter phocaeensis]